MAYSSSASINDIASNYVKNVGSGKEVQYSTAGLVADLETANMNNAWSAQQAQIQRDFERDMSNTSHQREVADLQAAGLNPVLSANSGASTPNAAVASTDTGATGSGSKTAMNAINAIVSQNNALVQANAQITSAALSASAMRYAADQSLAGVQYSTDNPNTVQGSLVKAILGATGSSSAKELGNKIKNAGKDVLTGTVKASTKSNSGKTVTSTLRYSTSDKYTQSSASSLKLTAGNLYAFNKSNNLNLRLNNGNLYYSQFRSFNDYLSFCAYFNFNPVNLLTFSTLHDSGYKHKLFK